MTHSMKYNTQSCRLVCKKELQPGIYDFTVESFKLTDYQHGEKIDRFPVAI